jgi:Smg protein
VWRLSRAAVTAARLEIMTTGSVLDILIYVFDRYMLDAGPEVPARARLARDLERAGFAPTKVERALDWLTELAFGHGGAHAVHAGPQQLTAVRVFTDSELARLSSECRGLLLRLEHARVLTMQQRELVIDRLLALDADEPDTEQLRWVVLMVLSSQPGHEPAIERLASLMSEAPRDVPH